MIHFSQKFFLVIFLFGLYSCADTPSEKGSTLEQEVVDLKEKIGQMILVGFRGTSAEPDSEIHKLVKDYKIGGVVLYSYDVPSRDSIQRNVVSKEQLIKLNSDLQGIRSDKLIISIDEEGGLVSRLKPKNGFESHISHQHIGAINNLDSTREWASAMAEELANLGVNMNFGPVFDLNINKESPIIGGKERSFSESADQVIANSKIFIEEHNKRKILCTPKHFPGHGSAKTDTHKGLTDVSTTWTKEELRPYEELIKAGYCDIIMTAHVYNEQLDTFPGTLSTKIIQDILRGEMGWDKAIISDDMQMGAINNFYSFEESISKAVAAGVDILLLSNNSAQTGYDPEIAIKAIEYIAKEVEKGNISEQRIDESYQRIMDLKKKI